MRNFLLANALYWLEEFHADGLRVDAVASMLYLDYSREAGEWLPNRYGGREDLDAVAFLQELNAVVHAAEPGVVMVAEESTAWPGVSRPTDVGGLGFTFKWNMGWMHDTLEYVSKEPVHRRWHHDDATFSLIYAWDENFVLPLSHDEVVHGKGALLRKLPGDEWQQFATLRALYGHMWAHPGKQLLFMGSELGQGTEWSESGSLDWYVLDYPLHRGVLRCVSDLNRVYRAEPALWELDHSPEGFEWLVGDAREDNVLAYARFSADRSRALACLANLSPVVRHHWRVPLPVGGRWREVLNTDAAEYGGSGIGNLGAVDAVEEPFHGRPFSADGDDAAARERCGSRPSPEPLVLVADVRLERVEELAEVGEVVLGQPRREAAVEGDDHVEHARLQREPGLGRLDAHGTTVVGVRHAADEPRRLRAGRGDG